MIISWTVEESLSLPCNVVNKRDVDKRDISAMLEEDFASRMMHIIKVHAHWESFIPCKEDKIESSTVNSVNKLKVHFLISGWGIFSSFVLSVRASPSQQAPLIYLLFPGMSSLSLHWRKRFINKRVIWIFKKWINYSIRKDEIAGFEENF